MFYRLKKLTGPRLKAQLLGFKKILDQIAAIDY